MTKPCISCHAGLPRRAYSARQWARPRTTRTCKSCVYAAACFGCLPPGADELVPFLRSALRGFCLDLDPPAARPNGSNVCAGSYFDWLFRLLNQGVDLSAMSHADLGMGCAMEIVEMLHDDQPKLAAAVLLLSANGWSMPENHHSDWWVDRESIETHRAAFLGGDAGCIPTCRPVAAGPRPIDARARSRGNRSWRFWPARPRPRESAARTQSHAVPRFRDGPHHGVCGDHAS